MKIAFLILLFGFSISLRAQEQVREQSRQLTIYFDFDHYDLNDNARQILELWKTANDSVEVLKIYGYCDWKGSNAYNDSLSLKRIRTVYDYCKSRNIDVRPGYEQRGFGEDFDQSKNQSENRKVTIVYAKPATQPKPGPFQAKVKNAKTGDLIRLENINFFNMSPRILPKSKPVLNDLLCALEDNPKLKIEIQGHLCCQTGTDYFDVSVARARAIYNYLITKRIDRKRLSFKGYGVTKPLHPIPEKPKRSRKTIGVSKSLFLKIRGPNVKSRPSNFDVTFHVSYLPAQMLQPQSFSAV